MKITILRDYLIFPVYTHATEKTLIFAHKGEPAFALNIKLDNVSPDFYAYIDVSLFKGEALEISVTPEMPILFSESDDMPIENLYRENDRPQVHFTVKNGRMGAPEALIRTDGVYVLLYAHDPALAERGNAHMGFAVSRDLLHWSEERSPMLAEDDAWISRGQARASLERMRQLRLLGERERTDVFSLFDREGERKWVSLRENGTYLVGERRDGVFTAQQCEKTLRYGSDARAGVTFADPERVVRMEWDPCPTGRFGGQMSVPMSLSLEKDADGYALAAAPIEELASLYKNTNRYENLTLGAKDIPLADAAHWLRLRGGLPKRGVLTMRLFGREVRFDFAGNRICAGGSVCPISVTGEALDLTAVVDRCGLEIFANGGRIYMSAQSEDMCMDRNLLSMTLRCDVSYCLDLLEIHSLESIW